MIKRAGPHPEIPRKTQQVFPTQDITDLDIIEEIDCLSEDYQPIAVETVHPDRERTGLAPILIWQGPSPLQSDPPKMRRVYKTLPGAWVTSTRIDPDGATVTIRTRKQLARLILTLESVVSGTWTKTFRGQGGDAVVADEIEESRPVLNAGAHVSAFPSYSVEIPERSIPPKLRSALPTTSNETIVEGTASLPTLQTGDFFRSQVQIDSTAYKLKVVNLALDALPVSVTEKSTTDKFGGGPTTITFTLSASLGTVNEGILVLSSHVEALGNGLYLKTSEVRDGSEWPILYGTRLDKQTLTAIQFSSQVIAAGVTGGISGNILTEVEPIDNVRSRKIISTVPTGSLDGFSVKLEETGSFPLPAVLVTLGGVVEKIQGNGSYVETGHAGWAGSGSYSLSLRGTGQASASVLPDVIPTIYQPTATDVPVTHLLFFMPSGSTRAAILARCTSLMGVSVTAWPKFRPTGHTIICIGKRASIQVQANGSLSSAGSSTSSSASATSGTGDSYEVGMSIKAVHIPPTIHGALSITPNSDSASISAHAAIGPITNSSGDSTAPDITRPDGSHSVPDVTGNISPTSLAATNNGGDVTISTSIPASGLRARIHSEPYSEYPAYIKVHCEVVDFANIG